MSRFSNICWCNHALEPRCLFGLLHGRRILLERVCLSLCGSRKGAIQKYYANSIKILRLESTNRFWKVCQIEKTISNPDLIHRSTYNFHENRKYFTIQESFQESFQNPENFRKSRKTFCHVTLAPVVGTLSRYSTLCHLVALGRLGVTTRTG